MKVRLSAPGKTFLIGEYAVLNGGEAWLCATGPRFELEIEVGRGGSCEGIHPSSPAGRWMRQQSSLFQTSCLRFVDPHSGKGGLGASSAQFLMVCAWSLLAEVPINEWPSVIHPQKIWQAYRAMASEGQGPTPSGADVMAQWMGGLTQFQSQPFALHSHSWPFAHLGFSLFRTSQKVATHQHLASLQGSFYGELKSSLAQTSVAIQRGEESYFIEGIRKYGCKLQELGLLHPQVEPMVESLRQESRVLAVKGCGALGADILLVLHRPLDRQEIVKRATEVGLVFEAGVESLEQGLRLEVEAASLPASGFRYQTSVFSEFKGGPNA
ncbi:MAG: hypothetical protein IT288_04915 [Bdellovibrionales bacterium]|nr:hypothetical protein [Bdellovibrionales bacterium]